MIRHGPIDEPGHGALEVISIGCQRFLQLRGGKRSTKYRAEDVKRSHAIRQHGRDLRIHIFVLVLRRWRLLHVSDVIHVAAKYLREWRIVGGQ